MIGLVERLKQRKLVQWALAYIAFAFALIQVLDVIADRFGWAPSVEKLVILALALGFVVLLLIAWYHGDKGQQWVSGPELLLIALVLAIGGVVIWGFLGRSVPGAATPRVAHAVKPAATSSATTPVTQSAPIPAKSIAVLPFENLSGDKNNAYFAAGMQDLILTKLADIGDLKVISRTSTMQYASRPKNLKTIGRQLGVATVLEGSVQKQGDTVLINVQLIDAKTDSHIWAQSYTRTLNNVFGVESEVATAVAQALNARLTDAERTALSARGTTNSAAWDAYLRGVALGSRGSLDLAAYRDAIRHFEQAVKLDPGFAQAWAQLAMAQSWIYNFYDRTPESFAKGRAAAATALRLAPNLGQAWLAQSSYTRTAHATLAALQRAHALLPNSSNVLYGLAMFEFGTGHWPQAIAYFRQAATFDPRNVSEIVQWSILYAHLRQFDKAHATIARALNVRPDAIFLIATNAEFYQGQGQLDVAGKLLAPLPFQRDKLVTACIKIRQWLFTRNWHAAITALTKATAPGQPPLGNIIGYYYAMLGLAEQRSGNAAAARASWRAGRDALKALEQAGDHSHFLYAYLALDEAGLGDAAAARQAARKGIATVPPTVPAEIDGAREYLARTEALLGEAAPAVKILAVLLTKHYAGATAITALSITPALLRVDPTFDPIRTDPRFQALLKANAKTEPAPSPTEVDRE